MALLSKRILSLLVGNLTMATRSLFDSVVSDWHRRQQSLAQQGEGEGYGGGGGTGGGDHHHHPYTYEDDDITVSTSAQQDAQRQHNQQVHTLAAVWQQSCKVVFAAMLTNSPSAYFERIMQGIREHAVSSSSPAGNVH